MQAPYNIERVLYFAACGNGLVVNRIMKQLEQDGKVTLPPEILAGLRQVIEESVSVPDDEIIRTIKRCYDQYGYVVCPHTATALSYFYQFTEGYFELFQKNEKNLDEISKIDAPV